MAVMLTLTTIVRLTGALLLTGLLAGAGQVAHAQGTSSPDNPPLVVVTRDVDDAPTGCRPGNVGALITRFFDASNRGDQTAVMTFFGPDFKWYGVSSDGEWDGADDFFAYTRESGYLDAGPWAAVGSAEETLPAYVAERHAYGEQLRLVRLGVYPDRDHGTAALAFITARSADDLPSDRDGAESLYQGKGQITCSTQTIVLLVMQPVQPDPSPLMTICPVPPGTPAAAAIVCGPPSAA